MDAMVAGLASKLVDWSARIVGVLLALLVALIVARWLQRSVERVMEKRGVDSTLRGFVGALVRYTVLTTALVSCLGVFGIQTTSIAAVLGSAGLAMGLAFQGTLSNFAAGVMLLVFRPFKVDDVIQVSGTVGKCTRIDLFTTDLVTGDNRKIIVPNKNVFGNTIENLTALDTRRVDVEVGVDYAGDIDATRETLEAAAKELDLVFTDPPPHAVLTGLGASSVDWSLRCWCKTADYWAVREALIRAAKRALDAKQLGIPFPQVDVHLDGAALEALGKK
ncbi:MAG: mechanosensitive ion channel [Myxococcales bacterium]|nr:mechanosensitive ion channel [Myxococcales bacterium]